MRRIASLLIVLCFSVGILCSCGHLVLAEEQQVEKATVEVELKNTYAKLKQWQIKYYKEHLRAIALEYTGLCFKDKRYIKAHQELERLNYGTKQP